MKRGRIKEQTPERDDDEQSRLFIEKAREIGADEKRSAADRLIGHLARKSPKPHKKRPK